MAASVVDLPVPVEPVTSTMPWWKSHSLVTIGGSASFSSVGTAAGVLAEHIDAEAPALGGHVGEVQVLPLVELLVLRARQDLGDVALKLGVPEVTELDRQQVPVHAQHRGHADGQMHVRAALLRAQFQKRVNARQAIAP